MVVWPLLLPLTMLFQGAYLRNSRQASSTVRTSGTQYHPKLCGKGSPHDKLQTNLIHMALLLQYRYVLDLVFCASPEQPGI